MKTVVTVKTDDVPRRSQDDIAQRKVLSRLFCDRIVRPSLHWSNVVGASHSKHYIVWQYGDVASRGVKEVCEFGYPQALEEEMRQHVSKQEKLSKSKTLNTVVL